MKKAPLSSRAYKLSFIALFLTTATAHAERLNPEKAYATAWCKAANGVQEFVLRDKTRVDCLTKNYAVEVDFADKWAESIGQALHYGRLTGEEPAIVLIIEKPSDWQHYWKVKKLAKKKGVTLWYIEPEYLKRHNP